MREGAGADMALRLRHWWWGKRVTRWRMVWDYGTTLWVFLGREDGAPRYLALEFKRQDCWVGWFFAKKYRDTGFSHPDRVEWHLWVCLVPCFPLHYARRAEVRAR